MSDEFTGKPFIMPTIDRMVESDPIIAVFASPAGVAFVFHRNFQNFTEVGKLGLAEALEKLAALVWSGARFDT